MTSNHTSLANRAVLFGGKGHFNRQELNGPHLYSSIPTLLIVPMVKEQFPYYEVFLSNKSVRLKAIIGDTYVFSLLIQDHNGK